MRRVRPSRLTTAAGSSRARHAACCLEYSKYTAPATRSGLLASHAAWCARPVARCRPQARPARGQAATTPRRGFESRHVIRFMDSIWIRYMYTCKRFSIFSNPTEKPLCAKRANQCANTATTARDMPCLFALASSRRAHARSWFSAVGVFTVLRSAGEFAARQIHRWARRRAPFRGARGAAVGSLGVSG